MSNGQLI